MNFLLTDGSFEGLLTAIFESYEKRMKDVRIIQHSQITFPLFSEVTEIFSDEAKTERVWKKILELFGKDGAKTIWKAWLSEDENIGTIIWHVISYGIAEGKNILRDFGNLYVLQLQEFVKKVGREKHRMEAFVRFEKAKDDTYFSVVEPDFNVLPLILPHFQNRYADQKWVIYDRIRNYGITYDLTEATIVEFDPNELVGLTGLKEQALHEDEEKFQQLWNNYFKSTNIAARKNIKLHTQHVPKRYWKFLTEKR